MLKNSAPNPVNEANEREEEKKKKKHKNITDKSA